MIEWRTFFSAFLRSSALATQTSHFFFGAVVTRNGLLPGRVALVGETAHNLNLFDKLANELSLFH
jgi:hypothetical protein